MVSHNNVLPNQHFKKKWQFYVKTWFNQPARKTRRQNGQCYPLGICAVLNKDWTTNFKQALDVQPGLRRPERSFLVLLLAPSDQL